MERDDVLKVFCTEDFNEISDDEIKGANKWICSVLLEDLNTLVGDNNESIQNFAFNLFESLLNKHGEDLESDSMFIKLKIFYRLFVNTSARSEVFKELSLKKLTVIHWLAILRFEDLLPETTYAICCFGKHIYNKYLLEKEFFDFISDLTTICNTNTKDHVHSSLIAFFWKLFEECPTFLSESFQSMGKRDFIYILGILIELTDNNYETESTYVKVHENNIYFMASLLERWCQDNFKEAETLRLPLYLMTILGTLGIHKRNYSDNVFTNKEILSSIKVILMNILGVEDKKGQIPGTSERFKALCNNDDDFVPLNDLKISCLRLVTNICMDNEENQKNAGEVGLLYPVLQCSFDKTTLDVALRKEWSVICIKALTDKCEENQEFLRDIKNKLSSRVVESLKEKTIFA
uniref:Atx10homo_assoc domain-containing protein n=1 Tax=Strongyloides venezuelensis TaxID=75913 RepID=A0A0K0G1D5_STRVS